MRGALCAQNHDRTMKRAMHNASVDFPFIRGLNPNKEQDSLIAKVHGTLARLLSKHEVNAVVNRNTGSHGPASLGFDVPDRKFVEIEVVDKLREIGVLDSVEVYIEEESGEDVRIYPNELE